MVQRHVSVHLLPSCPGCERHIYRAHMGAGPELPNTNSKQPTPMSRPELGNKLKSLLPGVQFRSSAVYRSNISEGHQAGL